MQWRCRERLIDLGSPVVMGILNVTPDSFSDGGRYAAADRAFDRSVEMVAEGAAIIDVGGESTRPGAESVAAETEIERVVPVIERITRSLDVAVSIDTCKPKVMEAALAAGACIVNDVCALRARGARELVAGAGAGVCLMHMQGEPRTMQLDPRYEDVVAEVRDFLDEQRRLTITAGVRAESIVLDPGIGFGKRLPHNLALLRELGALTALGAPVLVGVSRKGMIGAVLGRGPGERLHGGLGLAALAVAKGARVVRTHDVAPTWDAIRMVDAVERGARE
ncbi:MAG: dihydropteroate synthase [Gammaproteobacteria bacterium]|nr:dihydropteroate synthase [Gammaproteobacteria bacterium]